jgi:hypothetical protein
MPAWTDLKAEMAASWKVVWNVDPLPLSVPLRAALLLLLVPDEGLVVDVLLLDDELDEEHAARATAQTASPGYSLQGLSGLGRDQQPGDPANRGVPVQSGGVAGTGG